jgi:cell division protein FtsB
LCLLIIFGDNGFVDFILINSEKGMLIENNKKLEKKNVAMGREIDRLKNDLKFIENTVRKELGLIGRDELIFKTDKNNGAGK